jgi:ATP-dependent DNA ligase
MPRPVAPRSRANASVLPEWIRPQLTQLVKEAPDGDQWLHEINYDGFRMHARLDRREVRLLTRNGLDWTAKYSAIARAVSSLGGRPAYLDGELCGVRPDGIIIGALLLGYYDQGGRLIYAVRVSTGMRADQLAELLRRLRPLQVDTMPLEIAPPRSTRFGSPLVLSRVHWVRPELIFEVTYLTWTEDGLLRQVVYEGVREDKPTRKVVRSGSLT